VRRQPHVRRARALELDLSYAARRPWAPRRARFEAWTQAALPAGLGWTVLSVRVVGAARSRSLNARYRHKDKPTNVLSFGGAGPSPDGKHYLGELVICAPVVAQEADEQGKLVEAHWAHMTVHGVLHLLGFDHERGGEARKMEAREVQILDRLWFSNPYA
jgi:probable rRNA maturation factor